MVGQPLVQEREVRIDDVPRRQVGAQQFGEEEPRLLQRGQLQRVVELVIVVERGGRRGVVDLAQVEPVVGERLDEVAGARRIEQALGLDAQSGGGQVLQLGVGRGVPEKVREAARQCVRIERAGLLFEVQESGRTQDGGVPATIPCSFAIFR